MTVGGAKVRLRVIRDQLRSIPLETEFRNEYIEALEFAINTMDAIYLLAGDYFVSMSGDLPTDKQLEDEVNYYLQKAREE